MKSFCRRGMRVTIQPQFAVETVRRRPPSKGRTTFLALCQCALLLGLVRTAEGQVTYLSDQSWVSVANGWGPVERDRSNGELAAGDGLTITLNGKTYAKGLGVHANSDIRYSLGGNCSTFSAEIGVDDESGAKGSIVFQVWADGTKLFDSGIMYGNSATLPVSVNISGRSQLALIVTDAGNGAGNDHGDWANARIACGSPPPPPPPPTGTRYLSDLTPTKAVNGWGPVELDKSNNELAAGDGRTITLNGKTYAKGLGVHASSDVRFNLGGACSTFAAEVGIDDEVTYRGSVIFQVWTDGVKIYDSGVMYGNFFTQAVNLTITGKNELALIVTDGGDGAGSDHADWANAQINCGTTPTTQTDPIVLNGRNGVTISGVRITNPNGPCIIVTGNSQNIRVENSELGPCQGGLLVEGATNVTIDNNYIHDLGSAGNGVDVTFSVNVNITNNRIERIRTGIYVLRSTRVKIDRNRFLNVVGPLPRGQFVQFNHVYGAGNRIFCNTGQNVLGESYVVEAINLYDSFGEPSDPIQVIGNKILGGGPSGSSGAILLGDAGGSYQLARDNIIADPGQQGIGVGGGNNISVLNNTIYARQQYFTNVGIYVWNQDVSPCYNITVQGNSVNWTAASGSPNPNWNAGNCGLVAGWANNNWSAAIDANVINQPIAACSQ